MNCTHFHEIFLQKVLFHCNWPNGTRYANTEKKDWTEFSWRDNVYNAKFNVKTCLEHAYPIEGTYFH